MEHESHFGSAMNPPLNNSYKGHKFIKRLHALLLYFFGTVVSIMCAYIVGTGIAANGNFNELFGGRIFSYILAGLLQILIFMATIYLSTSRAWNLRALPMSLLLVATVVCFIAGEIAHSLLVQTKGSLGDSILRERALVLQNLHNRITAIDEFVSAAYRRDKQTLLHAVEEAKKVTIRAGWRGPVLYIPAICKSLLLHGTNTAS